MESRNPLSDKPFEQRGTKTYWPTIRGAYLDLNNIQKIRALSDGVILLEGTYHTRLNRHSGKGPVEQAIFFEHRIKEWGVRPAYFLVWIGNFYNGAVFHCAPQYPQCLNNSQEYLAYRAWHLYRKVTLRLYGNQEMDAEVAKFISKDNEPQNPTINTNTNTK